MRKYIKEEITDRVCRIMVSISNIMQWGILNQNKRIKSNLKKLDATFQFLLSQIFTSILLSDDLDRSVAAWSLIESSLKKELHDDDAIITEIDLITSDTDRVMQEIKAAIMNVQLAETHFSRWTNINDKKDQIVQIEKEIEETKKALEESQADKALLNEKIDALSEEKLRYEKIIKNKEDDDKNEKELEDRITKTFTDLTNRLDFLKKEETRNMVEYYVYNGILFLLMLGIALWLWILIKHTTDNNDATNWYLRFVPWYTPIPIFIAIFWVVIVFRNRANRYLLRIREELFKIKYSEGLLLAISRLSESTTAGAKRVTEVLDIMVKSYMNQIETSFLFESKKTERDTPVDASDISQITDTLSGLIEQVKGLTKSK